MRVNRRVVSLVSIVVFLAAWELAVRTGTLDAIYASSPSRIVAAAVELVPTPGFWTNVTTSALEFAVGFGLAAVTGIAFGLVVGWYPAFRKAVEPVATALYVTPRAALLPVIVLWLGFGWMTTAAVIFLGAFFMVFLNVMVGVATVNPALVRAARSFGAGDLRIFRSIVLPGTLPFVVTGLRLGAGRALIGIVIGEVYAASAGLGYFIQITGSTLQIDRMFVALAVLAACGLLFSVGLSVVERRLASWKPATIREV